MGTFNTYGYKKKRYGGSNPVWLTVSQKERCGGVLKDLPPTGTTIPAGSLVHIDEQGGAKIIETLVLAGDYLPTYDRLILRSHHAKLFTMGTFALMKAPENLQDKGVAFSLNSSTIGNDGLLYVLVEPNTIEELKEGDILVNANKVGAGATIELIPTGITENDVYIDEGVTSATVASVYHGEIMEDRIQAIPACLKAALPMIKFTKGI